MFKKEKKGSVFLYREKRGPLNKQVRKKKLMDFGLLGPFRSGTLWTGTIDRAGKSRTLHNKRSRGRKNGQPITHASTRLTRSNEPDPKSERKTARRNATDPTVNRYRREASLRNLIRDLIHC